VIIEEGGEISKFRFRLRDDDGVTGCGPHIVELPAADRDQSQADCVVAFVAGGRRCEHAQLFFGWLIGAHPAWRLLRWLIGHPIK